MKIILILTPARPGEKRKFTAPPLGLLYLGAYVKNAGHEVSVIDADVEGYTLDELAEKITAAKADLIGITVMTTFAANVLNLCRQIKKIDPNSKICLGGIHITSTGQEMMAESKNVDFLAIGEGENTLTELLDALENKINFSEIRGLVYRDKETGRIVKNEPRPLIQDLDSLPIPDLDLIENLNFKNYSVVHAGNKRVVYILGSRGCPFPCTFCAAYLVHGRKVRFRSPKKIVDEIEFNQKKYGISYVGFKDGTFTLNHQWAKEICQEIIGRKLKINFSVNARVDTINEEILKILKKAGCETIGFGIESGSQRILDKLMKGTNIAQIKEIFKLVNQYKFFTIPSFMIGNPGETKDDIKKTFELAKSIKATIAGFCPLTAFPGTKIYFDAVADGTLKNPKWYLKRNPADPEEFLPTGVYDGVLKFNDFETEKEVKIVYNKFYLRPAFIPSVIKRIIIDPYFLKYIFMYGWGLLRKTFDNT